MNRKIKVQKCRLEKKNTADHPSGHKMAPKERVSSDCVCVRVGGCVRVCHFPWYKSLCVYVFVIYFVCVFVYMCVCARALPNTYRDACRDTEGHMNTNTHI